MNSSSILPRQATKKAPPPPSPSSTPGAPRTPAPPPPPLLFWFKKKKKNRKRKKSRQGKRQKKTPPRPPPSQLNVVRGQKRTGFVHRRMCNSHPKPLRYVIWASLWLLRVKYVTNTEIITWKVRTNARFYSRVVMHQKKKKKRASEFFDALREMNKNRSCVLSKVWYFYFIHAEIYSVKYDANDCENTSFVQSESRKITFYSIKLSIYEIRSDVLWYDVFL